jgi:pilus assembly protein Flp/PilA
MYDYIRIRLQALRESERGASAVEYGLLVALIAAVIVGAVFLLGDALNTTFTETEACISNPTATGC